MRFPYGTVRSALCAGGVPDYEQEEPHSGEGRCRHSHGRDQRAAVHVQTLFCRVVFSCHTWVMYCPVPAFSSIP